MRSQTATEYLVIISVALVCISIIALLISDSQTINLGANNVAREQALKALPVGIENFQSSPNRTIITLRNNLAFTINVTAIAIDGANITSLQLPLLLESERSGDVVTNTTTSVAGGFFSYSLTVIYKDADTGMQVVQNNSLVEGTGFYE